MLNSSMPSMPLRTGYLYDADGARVAKGTITTMSCDPTANGFQITENYVLGPGGEELTTLDGSNTWLRTNVYVGGRLMATYDQAGLHFHLSDPLGTRRVQLSGNLTSGNQTSSGQPQPLGQAELDCQSLPYGDQQSCTPAPNAPPTSDDATPLHFTGKERDAESGNDYFGARYYASTMGRWMSPDWSAAPSGVPYAAFRNPQSLNLYAYVGNDPINGEDADGHISANMTAISFASGAFATAELALDEEELEFAPAGNVAASSDTTGSSSASGTSEAAASNQTSQTTPASAPPAGQQQDNGSVSAQKIDKNKIVHTMDKNAHGSNTYNGNCASACRKGLQAGGVNIPINNGHYPNANEYWSVLLKNGASVVPSKGYDPQSGDVVVFEGGGPHSHPNGHIAIYDGKQWVSDTRQTQMAPNRLGYPGGYTIYRFPN